MVSEGAGEVAYSVGNPGEPRRGSTASTPWGAIVPKIPFWGAAQLTLKLLQA